LSTAEAFFGNLEKIDDPGFQKEAVLLLKDIFPQLSEPSRQKILQWIEKGPSDELKEWLRKQEGVTEADVDSYLQRWRRDHFGILDGSLPEEYAKKLSDLVAQSGSAERLDARQRRSFGFYAPPAPKSFKELNAMSIDDVIEFLRSWQPAEGFFEANQEGLSRELVPLVTADPTAYA